jgi:hypothetical protein
MKYFLISFLLLAIVGNASAQSAKKAVQQKKAIAKKADTDSVAVQQTSVTGFQVAEIQKKSAANPTPNNQNRFMPKPGKEKAKLDALAPAKKKTVR